MPRMPRYRDMTDMTDMTNAELVDWADTWFGAASERPSSKLIYVLARRLEEEITRTTHIARQLKALPRVAPPHISKGQLCWRCEGILNSIGFGASPVEAYHAWARQLARPVQRGGHRHDSV